MTASNWDNGWDLSFCIRRWRRVRLIIPRTAEEVSRFASYCTWLNDAWNELGGDGKSEPWYWRWVEDTAYERTGTA